MCRNSLRTHELLGRLVLQNTGSRDQKDRNGEELKDKSRCYVEEWRAKVLTNLDQDKGECREILIYFWAFEVDYVD